MTLAFFSTLLRPSRPLPWPALLVLLLAGCLNGGEGQAPDPVVQDYAIAYVKRPLPETDPDARSRDVFSAGGDLYVRDLASPSAPERNITGAVTGGQGDVRDLEVSYDGTKLLFALRLPQIENADPDEQPTWNIWEYDLTEDRLRRVIDSDITAEAGQDRSPHYLPDGRIVFSSTRQRRARAILLDEGKPQFTALDEDRDEYAASLHVMNSDGTEIEQISFNPSHEFDPVVMPDGRIVFVRWDNMGASDAMNLYRLNPDGTGFELLYGAHSHDTGTDDEPVQFLDLRLMPDGRLLAALRPYERTGFGHDLVAIDVASYGDDQVPTAANQGLQGRAQAAVTAFEVLTGEGISPGGRFAAAFPLWDGTDRLLVAWSQCRVTEAGRLLPCTDERLTADGAEAAPPLYGLYVYDRKENTLLPLGQPEEGVIYTEVVALQPRDLPTVIYDKSAGNGLDADLVEAGTGVLHIRSLYDVDGVDTAAGGIAVLADPAQTTADQRVARFLRIVKAVSMPDRDLVRVRGVDFGRSSAQLMREIVAYAPVEPDGSVKIEVPANVPLTLSVLDSDGRRIGDRHENWFQLRPGETLECTGCHDHDSGRTHGRRDAVTSAWAGAPATGQPFPNTLASLWANYGESMAETRTRISCLTDCAARKPSVDLVYEDVWTDPVAAGRSPDAGFAYRYADLATAAPVSAECQARWQAGCRIVIHYEQHIQPLWERDRGADTCTACHSRTDAMGSPRVPEGQLELVSDPSDQQSAHYTSFRELLYTDNELELAGGVLQDRLVQATDGQGNPLYETDEDGNLILDGSGNPIPVMVTVPVRPAMSVRGAAASSRFFDLFAAGGSHAGRLEPAELRLIAEWLDIGAQYYNDPFAIPAN